ncbi:imm11 family protein [Paraliobacillus sp. JSM ZJ581]|uniref:imm11 family protein n=1 Tax=Paraliobacillus sp. JSM ZJ581 TaxID=3342118 RepID=UPI0035A93A2D
MKFYKLSIEVSGENDIVCHYKDDLGIQQYEFKTGQTFDRWDGSFKFYYDKSEGEVPTDYLANDMGWFVVSRRLKTIMETLNTKIEYFPVDIVELKSGDSLEGYYIANILKVVGALCLEESDYHEIQTKRVGTIYNVLKYAIYESEVENSDIFKLGTRQEIPIFVSEIFKKEIDINELTGMEFYENKAI